MQIKNYLFIVLIISFFSCSEDNDITTPRNLQEYIDANSGRELDNVIACAANANGNLSLTYVFYYPIVGATEIQYFETESLNVDENDFSNYKRIDLNDEAVFGGKLRRYLRNGSEENWCIVTYLSEGKLHKSNPIRLKNKTNPTSWKSEVDIDQSQSLMPKFTWLDFGALDNAIYFQVISDESDNFISGTYTTENTFQYYKTDNVVLNINTEIPSNLVLNNTYKFTLMAVSKDNWVNLVIQKAFVLK